MSVPKKKRKIKDLNKKEAVGDLLDAFKEVLLGPELSHSHILDVPFDPSSLNQKLVVAPPEPAPTPVQEAKPPAVASPPPEEADLTWEDKEDKLDAENIQPNPPEPTVIDMKYQYKEGERSLSCFSQILVITVQLWFTSASHVLHW